MSKDVLDQKLRALCDQAVGQAKAAVQAAPDGQWIDASEWPVRGIFQQLTQDCYQLILQARADAQQAAAPAAFSPSAGPGIAEQGPTPASGADRRRRS